MKIYAFKDPNNATSSSGGAFPAIIEVVKLIEGVMPIVYGAAFDDSFSVVHIRATNEKEYLRLRGSKYVRSSLDGIFESVYCDLNNGYPVIFSGTPCQIVAMKNRLAKEKTNISKLYLVDIVCHGTPKIIVWKDFKNWIEDKYNSRLVDFSFRYSKTKWKSYPIMAKFENGKQYVNSFKLRRYTELFYSDLTLVSGCYRCKYANINRISDITIGDFWGIRSVLPHFPYNEEVSQVLPNTTKGDNIVRKLLENRSYYMDKTDIENVIQYQTSFMKPTMKPKNVEEFWMKYKEESFETILEKYAGYNTWGFLRHIIKKVLGKTGFIRLVKNILKK